MEIGIVLFFVFFSLLLYVVLGGADFGAGVLELFSSKKNKELSRGVVYRVIGPVWEANHIWLIILLVVLWIGFPVYFNLVSIYLHIPMTLILVGITIRGVAFVIRHYDAIQDNTQYIYNRLFRLGSLMTPIFIGMTFGGLIYGRIPILENQEIPLGFYATYVAPWFNLFSLFIGFFYAAICAFLAATFLIGETTGEEQRVFARKSNRALISAFVFGAITLGIGVVNNNEFVLSIIQNPIALTFFTVSFLLLFPLYKSIKQQKVIITRSLAVTQVMLILVAALYPAFPELVVINTGSVSILDNTAPPSVIRYLAIALTIGSVLILPALFHLLKAFNLIKIFKN
jgi:cytochrome d ubiquinol oxidase subunit II